ncbi:hypothetical protein BT67DRAFT_309184 [Trichocladium antarcticum]|uniref:Uncharacterized protein n=1 Tax=Trichocladium antarcticum TaxID=1450529 RepID=A0AAN6UK68_9PEZI|nr:hypothetical protein BT67DRAFT_309184 [Trichocladium antarcticum]
MRHASSGVDGGAESQGRRPPLINSVHACAGNDPMLPMPTPAGRGQAAERLVPTLPLPWLVLLSVRRLGKRSFRRDPGITQRYTPCLLPARRVPTKKRKVELPSFQTRRERNARNSAFVVNHLGPAPLLNLKMGKWPAIPQIFQSGTFMAPQPVTASATSNASRKQGSAPTWSSHATVRGWDRMTVRMSDTKHLQTAFRLAGPGLPPAPAIAARNPSADRCAGLSTARSCPSGLQPLPPAGSQLAIFQGRGPALESCSRRVPAAYVTSTLPPPASLIERVFASELRWRLRPGHTDYSTASK